MKWYIKLLVIGFLLWDQNNVTSGDDLTNNTGSSQSDQQASTTTVSMETPILTVNSSAVPNALTSPVFSNTSQSDPQARNASVSVDTLILANTSSAVFTALTPLFNSNVTAATQAPTASTNLTSAFTTGPTSSDSHLSTSPEPTPTMSVSPSTSGDIPDRCSGVKFRQPSYNNKTEDLNVEKRNNSIHCENITCQGNYIFKLDSYQFCVNQCQPKMIKCQTNGCNISLTLTVPPDGKSLNLTATPDKEKATFTWTNIDNCNVTVNTTCTDEENGETFFGGENVDLEPYRNYSCVSNASYKGKVIKTKTKNIKTKIGEPEKVQNLGCESTNTTIKCTWAKPNKTNGPFNKYVLYINNDRSAEYKENKDVLMHTFEQLDPFTDYKIEVEACNYDEDKKDLCGTPESNTTKTKPGVPTAVHIINKGISSKSNNEITISCNRPTRINGDGGIFILTLDGKTYRDEKCKFAIPGLSYLTTYKYEIYFYNLKHNGVKTIGQVKTRYNDKALIGFLAFLITITSLALIFVLIKIYKLQRRSSSNNEDSIPLTNQDEEKLLLDIEPIPVEQLLDTYKKKNADEGRLFLDEFQSIPRVFSKFPIKEARKPCNQAKNRYIDILPYDDNRVVLSEIHGEPGSDYINASYVNGFKEPRKYIAAQGPKEETMTDFWRMIWEQKSTIIVMVTRCEEGNRNKCAQYWPSVDGETEAYGDIVVKITDQKLFPDYITRKLHVTHRREKTGRDITHIQFTVWPDHGVPDDPNLLLKLRRRVNALNNFFSGPIIVHCSAGVGRTGTYISIDAMLECLEAEGRVNVYDYVVQLRRQRCLMVQVEFQYIFIHKALVEYNQFGETEVSMAELPLILNSLKKKDSPSEPSQLTCEFQRLPSYRNWRPQTTGNHQDNKDKNRFASVVPYEFNRAQIKTDEEPEQEVTEDSEMSSDDDSDSEDSVYINASYITGYWGTREIIAAQAPLKNTLSEFWQMVFQKKAKAIVMLSAPNQENNENSCAPYWKEKSKTYDILQVELTSEKSHGSYTERCFEITHAKRKDVRKVSQFHYEQWGEAIPLETKELLDMIDKIKKNIPVKRKEEHTRHDKSVPLIVHCSDGSQLTGTFSALWYLLESARVEGDIDVFQTVKNLRRLRSGIVSSFEQYQFLYDVMASTVPVKNGQIRLSKEQDKMEIENELKSKFPEVAPSSAVIPGEETLSKPKDDDTTANGPSPAEFTDVTLRIEE
ncbi:receptor-type tyrosine-protein phosphatase C isoform X3 [Rana temporaria]|uniref:receptor-type tyrosine-protein phosphatase C isoform X3 n=1 Tax=Rana temporaria TaxID=8407 RepID=UPI001AAE042E|nr:receptor-type tyrosine-protein phosphatase C isoform X3 [Rana temporaria]